MQIVLLLLPCLWTGATGQPKVPANLIASIKSALTSSTGPTFQGILSFPASNRTAWNKVKGTIPSSAIINGQSQSGTVQPPWNDTAYLLYKASGDRFIGETMMAKRTNRLVDMIWAELSNGTGSMLPTIFSDMRGIATQRTWTWAAHDKQLLNFNNIRYEVELNSAYVGSVLSHALFLFADKIDSNTRVVVSNALMNRIFKPVLDSLKGIKPWQVWMDSNSNWNAVCWSGVISAVHSFPDTKLLSLDDRAFLTAAAWTFSSKYLDSFSADFFVSEGVTYFNYGYANFALLREAISQATAGKYDLFAGSERTAKSSLFALEFPMSERDSAPFGDSVYNENFNPSIVKYLSLSFGIPASSNVSMTLLPTFMGTLIGVVNRTPTKVSSVNVFDIQGANTLRKFYPVSGVLVARPSSKGSIAATFKLGGNGAHSHNDIGSYVISVDGSKHCGDPGRAAIYDERSFGPHRYDSFLMNSFGHPVPVVDGKMQVEASELIASAAWKQKNRILGYTFSPEKDTVTFDLKPAYDVAKLNSLNRTITYDRVSDMVTISDSVKFTTPGSFQSALVTRESWKAVNSTTGYFSVNNRLRLWVKVLASSPFFWNATKMTDYGVTITRIGIYLTSPVTVAKIDTTFWKETL